MQDLMGARLTTVPSKRLLDSVRLDRYAAIATLASPALAWLWIGRPTDLQHAYGVSLVFPFADLVACGVLAAGAVVFYHAGSELGRLQWMIVGALLALYVAWGFSIGALFFPTLIGASIAACLSDGLHHRSVIARICEAVLGASVQLVIAWLAGYLHFSNVTLPG
jgi:hypothetical protein